MGKEIIIIIHGFGGDTKEIEPLAQHLRKGGYDVCTPILAGHGEDRGNVRKTTYQLWLQSVEQVVRQHKKPIIIGFSMGGLIAIEMCIRFNLEKLVLINTPVYVWNMSVIAWNILREPDVFIPHYFGKVRCNPPESAFQFMIFKGKVKKRLHLVKASTLIIQTKDDDTVRWKSAQYIYEGITCDKQLIYVGKGGHLVLYSSSCDEVCQLVSKHL